MEYDFRQSIPFTKYLEFTGRTIKKVGNTHVLILKLPFGSIIGIPRPKPPIKFLEIDKLAKKEKAILVKIEPSALSTNADLEQELKNHGYQWDSWAVEPTKTIVVDLTLPKSKLFSDLSHGWRRDVRIAQKNNVQVLQSKDINAFNKIWQDNAKRKSFPTETPQATTIMWQEFKKKKASNLLFAKVKNEIVAASLIILWDKTAHLWHLAYSGKYQKLRPLYLLVWESLLLAKSKGLKEFDFEGIYDSRLPYSKKIMPTIFKRGFGGSEKTYLGSYVKFYKPPYSLPYKIMTKIRPEIIYSLYRSHRT